ncbi:MAG: hypothetical protein WC222_04335 [Parachlamydiales bacterium]|jgi:hypothetical protein
MNITISAIRCALQVALLGSITPNLRAINTNLKENTVELYFYYETPPSEEEEELSEIVVTEIYADFIDISINIHRIVLSLSDKIPEIGLRIFHRKE